jgi:hypothetical protein
VLKTSTSATGSCRYSNSLNLLLVIIKVDEVQAGERGIINVKDILFAFTLPGFENYSHLVPFTLDK